MTEKRFTVSDTDVLCMTIIDNENGKHYGFARDIAIVMNELYDENKELTEENEQLKDKYNEQSVQYEGLEEQVERLLDFKDKVFNLINAKIKLYSHKPISAPISQPLSVNFDEDMDRLARLSELEALKEELTE